MARPNSPNEDHLYRDEPKDRTTSDERDDTRFHDLLRNEIWGAQTTHGPNTSSLYGVSGGSHVGRGPKNYRRSDTTIFEDVCEALRNSGDIDASDIEVQVLHGEVTLEGRVQTRHMKRLAEDIVDNLQGVNDVHNRLQVKGPFSQ